MILYAINKLLAKTEQYVNNIEVRAPDGISYTNAHPFLTAFARRARDPSSRRETRYRFFHTQRPLY